MRLDLLLEDIVNDSISGSDDSVYRLMHDYPGLNEKQAREIFRMIAAGNEKKREEAELVVTAPPSFMIPAKTTKVVVDELIRNAKSSITMTGYSLSTYFDEMVDCIVRKSQSGVFVKFFVNNIDKQKNLDKLYIHRSRFLKIYNYPENEENKSSALHAKVISVDKCKTLITSANLSYNGQEGNIEVGTFIESTRIAKQLEETLTRLIFSGVFTEVKDDS